MSVYDMRETHTICGRDLVFLVCFEDSEGWQASGLFYSLQSALEYAEKLNHDLGYIVDVVDTRTGEGQTDNL